ncbi:MAG: hypothetical protein QM487_07930 [Candidatus Marithrix sp.]
MNSVKLMVEELITTPDNKGIVQSINDSIMTVITNGSIQKWPIQDGIQTGDNIVIQNGRLIKIPVPNSGI